MESTPPKIRVTDLQMGYDGRVFMRGITFDVNRGEIFIVMGPSGCGKSTLLRNLIGLIRPYGGDICYDGKSFTKADDDVRRKMLGGFGVLYQGGALWSGMTLAENVMLPLGEYTDLRTKERVDMARYKLSLVGLSGFEDYYPSQISGGMRKRAGLARALALDPPLLFLDEPSAGLDPISSRRLDDLLLRLRDTLGITMVIVTHELASIFAIGDSSVFLDPETGTALAVGPPAELRDHSEHEKVRVFLRRGEGLPDEVDQAASATSGS